MDYWRYFNGVHPRLIKQTYAATKVVQKYSDICGSKMVGYTYRTVSIVEIVVFVPDDLAR